MSALKKTKKPSTSTRRKWLAATLRDALPAIRAPRGDERPDSSYFPRVAIGRARGCWDVEVVAAGAFFTRLFFGDETAFGSFDSFLGEEDYTACIVALELAAILAEEGEFV